MINFVTPKFKFFTSFFTDFFDILPDQEAQKKRKERSERVLNSVGLSNEGPVSRLNSLGVVGSVAKVLITQFFDIKGRKISTKTITEQNRSDTGAINRTTGRRTVRAPL